MTKSELIHAIERRLREKLLHQRGQRCQVCGGYKPLTLFHILPKSRYPRLRFVEQNILLVCWNPCHYNWHNGKPKKVERAIQRLRGKDYKERLKAIQMPKLTKVYLENLWKELI